MDKRDSKQSDQEMVEKAFNLLKEYMSKHPEIEPTLWAGAFWSCLADGYNKSGMSYEEFSEEWENVKEHYKSWFEI
jgi:hypothetical protein